LTVSVILSLVFINSVYQNEREIDRIYELSDIKVRFVNIAGVRSKNLNIRDSFIAPLTENDILKTEHLVTRGLFSKNIVSNERLSKKDIYTLPIINGIINISDLPDESPEYLYGYDASVFLTEDNVCLVNSDYLIENNLQLGDTIQGYYNTYSALANSVYESYYVAPITAKIVGRYNSNAMSPKLFFPYNFMRNVCINAGRRFSASQAEFSVIKPQEIDRIKNQLKEMGIGEIAKLTNTSATYGDTVLITDKDYIGIIEPVLRNTMILKSVQYPVLMAVAFLASVISSLLIRNRRREFVIEISLGISRLIIFLHIVLENFLVSIIALSINSLIVCIILNLSITSCLLTILLPGIFYLIGTIISALIILNSKYYKLNIRGE
jgi:hypothetical protein